MARTPKVTTLTLTLTQRGEICFLEFDQRGLRYGPDLKKYHLLVQKFDYYQRNSPDGFGDPVMSWSFTGVPREFSLDFPEGHSSTGAYEAVVIDNYTGNDASHVSNTVLLPPYSWEKPPVIEN